MRDDFPRIKLDDLDGWIGRRFVSSMLGSRNLWGDICGELKPALKGLEDDASTTRKR
ncbi:hypothetical protein M2281_002757 [Mesorhizobium soli]|uniref:hypothetical protein n=1 Tax=Pseudaminobacter soli (ex Li et al. 2025) TaxID=1295366 RepID=UPI002475A938|nr:hypothetical protein [Mesorhizobium soli]MDH6232159.1 hypothetical protein [Mesorhizobium soli]